MFRVRHSIETANTMNPDDSQISEKIEEQRRQILQLQYDRFNDEVTINALSIKLATLQDKVAKVVESVEGWHWAWDGDCGVTTAPPSSDEVRREAEQTPDDIRLRRDY